jgi:signal transduction histidine kinase
MALAIVPLVFLGVVMAAEAWLIESEENLFLKEARSKRITALSSDLAGLVLNCRAGLALYAFTHNSSHLSPLARASGQLASGLEELKNAIGNEPVELQDLNALDTLTMRFLASCQDYLAQKREEGDKSGQKSGKFDEISQLEKEINAKCDALRLRELYLTGGKPSELILFREKFQTFLLAVAILAVCMAMGMAFWFSRQIAQRLILLSKNADRLAQDQPLLTPLSGEDEISHVDRAFQNAAQALRTTATLRRQFVSMITHDLRSPLNSISLVLQSLAHGLHGEIDAEAQESIADANASSRRMLELVDELLLYEQVTGGELLLNYKTINLAETLEESIREIKKLASANGVEIELEKHSGQSASIEIDSDGPKLIRVLVNLLSNAIKFSPPGGTVKLRWSLLIPDRVQIEVTDQGRGIPQDQITRIFERYTQLERQDASMGTGLGLPICKAIITSMHGELGVESEIGKGSRFWIILPLHKQLRSSALIPPKS